jgi:hypothetical protein
MKKQFKVTEKNKNIEVSLSKFYKVSEKQKLTPIFKVTRRYPLEGVQDTKLFEVLKEAKKQFKRWLGDKK